MHPTPSAPRTSRSRSSIQRLNIEYEGWWMSSGVPEPAEDGDGLGGALVGVGGDADVEGLARR